MTELTPLSEAERALTKADTPEKSRKVEAISAAAIAWAKEQDDFELHINAWEVYVKARRNTTELIEPEITQFHGNRYIGGDDGVTSLKDYGFTKKQWSRRKKEYEIGWTIVEDYLDECIEKTSDPTIAGLVRYAYPYVPEEPPELPDGIYNVIYADPPWAYDNQIENWGPTSLHYKPMTTDMICKLGVLEILDKNAVLFLWVTNPMIKDALSVMDAWGFEYKTNIVWVKTELQRPGSGFYVRGRHELLFIGTHGSFTPLERDISPPIGSVIEAPVQEHSRKPDKVYEIVERLYPGCKYIELFARRERQGWDNWGDEI